MRDLHWPQSRATCLGIQQGVVRPVHEIAGAVKQVVQLFIQFQIPFSGLDPFGTPSRRLD
jgi:hypothetical protein